MSNVNSQEVEKFDALAYRWWDLEGPLKALHDINPWRIQFIQEQVDIKNKEIADIGCGGGILTEALAKKGAKKVVGIDMSEKALRVARQHAKQQGSTLSDTIEYIQQTGEAFALENPERFDVVVCMELLEHVPNPASLVKACSQLVKPSGIVCFSTLNRTVRAFALAIVGAEYIMNLLERGTHNYAQFIRPHELDAWARQHHLTIKQIKGMAYNPFTGKASTERKPHVNYSVSYQKR